MMIYTECMRHSLYNILRWSEQYTRTDMIYATKGGFWLVAGKAAAFATSLLLAAAMANLIPQSVFGIYKFVLAGAGMIGAFTLSGMGGMITQSVSRGFDGTWKAGARTYLQWSVGSIALSLAVSIYYFLNDNVTLAVSFLAVALCSPLFTSSSFFLQFLFGKQDFKRGALFDIVKNVVPVLCIVGTIFIIDDPVYIVLVYFLSNILINLILTSATERIYHPQESVDPIAISYSKHLSIIGAMGKISENIDKVLVFHYLGAAQLAVYAFAQTPIAQLKLLNDIPVKLAYPKLATTNVQDLQSTLPRKILLLVGLMSMIVVGYVLIAPHIFKILFPAYTDAIPVTQALALSLIFLPGSIYSDALAANMRKRELYKAQAILPALRIGLYIALLPIYGLWGAVWATIISQMATFAVFAYFFRKVSA